MSIASETWQAGAGLFSGRPDPAWSLAPELVAEFRQRWQRLALQDDAGDWRVPPLGYRGCHVSCGDLQWHLFAGRARLTQAGAPREARLDAHRALERWVLETAPGALRQVIEPALRESS